MRSGRIETSYAGRKWTRPCCLIPEARLVSSCGIEAPALGIVSTCPNGPFGFDRARERKGKARAFPFGALHGEIAFHRPCEIATYRQSQPNAAFPIGVTLLQLDEW